MNRLDGFISRALFAVVAVTITLLMIKSVLLSYFKIYTNRDKRFMKMTTRVQNADEFLSRNKNFVDDESLLLFNEDLLFYSVSLCDFFSNFDCRNMSKLRRSAATEDGRAGLTTTTRPPRLSLTDPLKTKTIFALPNGAV